MRMMVNHGCGEVITIVSISALAEVRIGDQNFIGVVTKSVTDILDSLFMLDNVTASLRPAYIAVGTGNDPATPYDTNLENEIARHQITQLTQSSGITTALVNLPVNSTSFTASEMGVFTRDGTMIARANVQIEKNENSILNIIWMLSIKRG